MPQIIHGPRQRIRLDGSVRRAAYDFLEKLQDDDTLPGLHVEPINGSVDPRARTGRVSDFWRAVLIKVGDAANSYIYLGVHPHDEAIEVAKTVAIRINPLNGIPELTATPPVAPVAPVAAPRPRPDDIDTTAYPLLETQGISVEDLRELGIDAQVAEQVVTIADEDTLEEFVQTIPNWQGLALLDLAFGKGIDGVRESLQISTTRRDISEDDTGEALIEALQHPAARAEFAFIGDQEELREVIESDDFAAWRVFLHPEQRQYAEKSRNGSFRLSGGAGTGKTVVLLHRARHLARQNPNARIVLTTYNRTLAEALRSQLQLLDASLPMADRLGQPGIFVAGVDQIAYQLVREAGDALGGREGSEGAVASVLGPRTVKVQEVTPSTRWHEAVSGMGEALPTELRSVTFLEAEYNTVVLPNRIRERGEYLRVRRPGRKVPLDRARRNAVWSVFEAYRASSAAVGSADFDEKAMIAVSYLNQGGAQRVADHVLVDEAQDLTPSRLLLMRALAEAGPNDLFLAEDSHQRIYGQKIVLSKYGINIRGRSRRLTLNYRTTHQNLQFAVQVLGDDSAFMDLDAEPAGAAGYRAARRGPEPELVATEGLVEEYERLAQVLAEWLEVVDSPETIGVLVYGKGVGESVQRALAERGIEARFIASNADLAPGKVSVMTMHRSKGMEFSRAVLFGIEAGSEPSATYSEGLPEQDRADALLRDRSLLYVAATRARDELVVMWRGERSDLLPAG
ncbi:AAA family ATPase [Ruania suaedae]|uniref:UvrD-helicase domain-containing protein n=1 Tax=Ruania suaedae TaxID=2897774 RepID=UPI001E30170C|nr:UvrD-helicase domain-containing protein [Ruania suaedae]UFU01871.1 AAA family ATPase [Ruania suaedae]